MTTMHAIVTATDADVEDIGQAFDAYRQFYRQSADLSGAIAFIRERVEQQTSQILLARHNDGDLMGFTQLYPSFSSVRMRPIWVLNDLFVYPNYRRRGIARALMQAAQEMAVQSGAAALALATENTNDSAQALYQSLGYAQDLQFLHYQLSLQ